MPYFSIVIPSYNSSTTIFDAIESCRIQSFSDWELIVVDDCSSDNSIELVRERYKSDKRIKIYRFEENRGPAYARNWGWDMASGQYICFLDADDTWDSNKLSFLYEIIIEYQSPLCIGHWYSEEKRRLKIPENGKIKKLGFTHVLLQNPFNTSCLTISSECKERFNEDMRYTEDHELLVRIVRHCRILLISRYLTLLGRPQLTSGGLSGNKWCMRKGEMKMYINIARLEPRLLPFVPFLILFSLLKHCIKLIILRVL